MAGAGALGYLNGASQTTWEVTYWLFRLAFWVGAGDGAVASTG